MRHEVEDAAEVTLALGFLPTEFMIDGCVILVIIWKRERYGSVYALAAASALPGIAHELAGKMLEYAAEFLDQKVPWNWYFDGPDREHRKRRVNVA